MIRIASVFPVPAHTLVRPAPAIAAQRAPIVLPVTPAPALSRLAPDANAAQSEAAFAVAADRNAPPPIQPGELSIPTDPLPDLPALGIAPPDPDAIAAEMAKLKAQQDQAKSSLGPTELAPETVPAPPDPATDVPSPPRIPLPPQAQALASLAVDPR